MMSVVTKQTELFCVLMFFTALKSSEAQEKHTKDVFQ